MGQRPRSRPRQRRKAHWQEKPARRRRKAGHVAVGFPLERERTVYPNPARKKPVAVNRAARSGDMDGGWGGKEAAGAGAAAGGKGT
jgi:hypothetical protein